MLPSTRVIFSGLLKHDRSCLARAITLVESTRMEHREQAEFLLRSLMDSTQSRIFSSSSLRIGIAGPPGAGKSTLIESLGLHILGEGSGRLAVLAVDPSSSRTGGSILGDKTRMGTLSQHPRAYVRPTPARGFLGGVARATHEVVQLCEGAGYGTVLVETVGLGQSETAVETCVDCTVLVLPPASGDELQGVKKGIVECADIVVVNKADGRLEDAARLAAAEYRNALSLSSGKHASLWVPVVLTTSAATGSGVGELWETLGKLRSALGDRVKDRRREQCEEWMWSDFREGVVSWAEQNPGVMKESLLQGSLMEQGKASPRGAARALLEVFMKKGASSRSTDVRKE